LTYWPKLLDQAAFDLSATYIWWNLRQIDLNRLCILLMEWFIFVNDVIMRWGHYRYLLRTF
jgi:hypothetical protein